MPELPEVEILKRYFDELALHKEISDLEFHDPLNKIFLSPKDQLLKTLCGDRFVSTERIGKYLFARLSKGMWLHLHFGMTGDLQLVSLKEDLPKHTRFVIRFKDGERLAYRDLRKFGVIELVESPKQYQSEKKIGVDLLEIEEEDFIKALKGRKAPIKSLLLQQNKVAGIGNWIADEMLFQAGVHPAIKATQLTENQLSDLFRIAVDIVNISIAKDTHYGKFPEGLFVNFRKEGVIHPDHPNSPIQFIKVGGRGTYFVPEKQLLDDDK